MKQKVLCVLLSLALSLGFLPVNTYAQAPEKDEIYLQSLDEIPSVSAASSVEDQIVVVYEKEREDNIACLDLTKEEIQEGEKLGDTVDLLTPDEGTDIDALIAELEQKPGVAAVSRNDLIEIDDLPNDPYVMDGTAWHYKTIGADQTWNKITSPQPVKVAVIDTGINVNHPDLQGRFEIGYDYLNDSATLIDDLAGHGTSVSGTIAAVAGNAIGTAGVAGTAPVKIVAYRAGGSSSTDRFMNGAYITAALEDIVTRADIQVVNMSFGGDSPSTSTRKAAFEKLHKAGKILVASAGNDGDTRYNYPASEDYILSVGATTSSDTCADFSNRNKAVDLCAPGAKICTTTTSGGYGLASGTSFSSPIVAGAAAVLKCANGGLTGFQIEQILLETAKDLGAAGKDNLYGHGLLQLDKAVAKAGQTEITEPLSIASFETSKLSPQPIHDAYIYLSASAQGGYGSYEYRFTQTFNGKTTVLQDYGNATGLYWEPQETGDYILGVSVRDMTGETVSKSLPFTIQKEPFELTIRTERNSPQPAETEIHLSADPSYIEDLEYYGRLTVTHDGITTTLSEQDDIWYTNPVSCSWKPQQPGTYTITAYVRDDYWDPVANTEKVKEAEASIEFEIIDASTVVSDFTIKRPYYQEAGDLVTLTADAVGGTGDYHYKFTATLDGTEQILQDYAEENSLSWTPMEAGAYTISVYAKDSAGTVGTSSRGMTVKQAVPVISGFSPTHESPCPVGTTATFHLSSYRGLGEHEYRFTATKNGVTTVLKDFDSRGSVTWIPQETGLYTLRGYVRDEAGTTVSTKIDFEVILPFDDVYDSDWYRDAIEYNCARNIMKGKEYNIFAPLEPLVRAQFAVILHRMNDSPYVEYANTFPDIADDLWYTTAVLWANQAGVVTGYTSTGCFGPSDNITREQMAVMMYRYAVHKSYDTSQRKDLSSYADASSVSGFARDAMQWAVANRIITGKYNETTLDPQGYASRAECATIIMRFMETYTR